MEVILKKNVDKLGYANDVVSVKPGYGRNFLIPQGYAILATASAKKAHEDMMKQKYHKETKLVAEAEEIATKIAGLTVTISTKAGENGKIFGSINTIQLIRFYVITSIIIIIMIIIIIIIIIDV